MYDPKHSLFFAWKEIIRHWKMLYEISIQNKKKGYSFLSYSDGKKMLKENTRLVKKLDEIKFCKTCNIQAEIIERKPQFKVAK
jgi:hypothetical protein